MRPGKSVKRRHHFKIVVVESTSARDSRFVDQIGHYDPSGDLLKVSIGKYEQWVKKGAQPTKTVASLYKKYKKQETQNKAS